MVIVNSIFIELCHGFFLNESWCVSPLLRLENLDNVDAGVGRLFICSLFSSEFLSQYLEVSVTMQYVFDTLVIHFPMAFCQMPKHTWIRQMNDDLKPLDKTMKDKRPD